MQPTAYGARDRWFFEAFLCCAPTAAADTQAVGAQHGSYPYRSGVLFYGMMLNIAGGTLWGAYEQSAVDPRRY
jgi:hypothetical protein